MPTRNVYVFDVTVHVAADTLDEARAELARLADGPVDLRQGRTTVACVYANVADAVALFDSAFYQIEE